MRKVIKDSSIAIILILVAIWLGTQIYDTIVTIPVFLNKSFSFILFLIDQLVGAFTWLVSNPLILIGALLVGGIGIYIVWNRAKNVDIDVGSIVTNSREFLENNISFFDQDVVRGSIEHEGVRWIGRYKRSGRTVVGPRACKYHAIKLRSRTQPHAKAHAGNSPMSADEKTIEYEDQSWKNIHKREKVENEELIDALVCPYDDCSFSIPDSKHQTSDENAVRTQFENHFEQMRTGGSDPFAKWRTHAKEQHEFEPTPADIWDAYQRDCDDPSVMKNWSRLEETRGGESGVSCDALEDYKDRADGIDQFIELCPPKFDRILAFLLRSRYLKDKDEIREKMNKERQTCREQLQSIEQKRGSTVERTVTARHKRAEPQINNKVAERELSTAVSEISELRTDLRMDYLSYDMKRWLSVIEDSILEAVEYIRELCEFQERKEKIEPQIEAFENRFEPYQDVEEYMTTKDKEFLRENGSAVHGLLDDLTREVQLDILPPDRMEWAIEKKTRFSERLNHLSGYNEKFEERECERYQELFETEHGSLNEEQQRAIVRNDHHNLVDASAGTGKTLTLTYRFLYLYRRGVPLDDIVAVTYTREAADEMKNRIDRTLNGVNTNKLNILTYHSFANKIVDDSTSNSSDTDIKNAHKRYAEGFINGDRELETRHQELMEEFEEYHAEFLRTESEYIDDKKGRGQSRNEFLCKKYKKFLSTARNFSQAPDEIRARLTRVKIHQYHFGQAACTILEAFLDHAEASDEPVDFLDMVNSARQLGEEAPEHFGQEYQHILFDEFQDVDESALNFVKIFLNGSGDTRLFAVGDDWQSIYGFKGSDPSHFIEFEERFEGVAKTQLAINYRCPPTVVKAGEEVMANSEDDLNTKNVEASSDLSTTPVAHKLGGVYERRAAAYVTDMIEKTVAGNNTKPADVMVLSRNNDASRFMDRIRSYLDEREIPRMSANNSNIEEDSGGVQVRSIHKSKGKEAKHVILVNATDGEFHGLPSEKKENELIKPAIANPATHYAEERRLFYVAMTRTERDLHIITQLDNESRYLGDVSEFFDETKSVVRTIEGTITEWRDPGADNNRPIKAKLACDDYEVKLMAWPEKLPQKLEEGKRYRLSNIKPKNDGYGEEIELNGTVEIEELEQ